MAAQVTPCPGLDLSWQVLDRLMGLVGIDPEWAAGFTRGATLASLVDMHGDERLRQPVGRYLGGGTGGWLWNPEHYLRRLDTSGLHFPGWVPSDEVARFETAVEEATIMLTTARDRGAALRMVIS